MSKKYVPLFEEYCHINEISSGRKAAAKYRAKRKYGSHNANAMYSNISASGNGDLLYEDDKIFITVDANGYADLSPYADRRQGGATIKYIIRSNTNKAVPHEIKVSHEMYLGGLSDIVTIKYIGENSGVVISSIMPELLRDKAALAAIVNDINDSTGLNITWKELVSGISKGRGVAEFYVDGDGSEETGDLDAQAQAQGAQTRSQERSQRGAQVQSDDDIIL